MKKVYDFEQLKNEGAQNLCKSELFALKKFGFGKVKIIHEGLVYLLPHLVLFAVCSIHNPIWLACQYHMSELDTSKPIVVSVGSRSLLDANLTHCSAT